MASSMMCTTDIPRTVTATRERWHRHGTASAHMIELRSARALGVDGDPVTGSAHCTLIPYWTARLGKSRLEARQISRRSGRLFCELRGDRVSISGRAGQYMEGAIGG